MLTALVEVVESARLERPSGHLMAPRAKILLAMLFSDRLRLSNENAKDQ